MDEITFNPKAGDTLDEALIQMNWVIGGLGTVWGRQDFADGRVRIYKLKPGPTQRGWGNQVDAYSAGAAMGLNMFAINISAELSPTGKAEYFPPTHEVYYSGRKEDHIGYERLIQAIPTLSATVPLTQKMTAACGYTRRVTPTIRYGCLRLLKQVILLLERIYRRLKKRNYLTGLS